MIAALRLVRGFLPALACGAMVTAPISAQSPNPPASQPTNPVSTPAQDLDCAIWASYTLGALGPQGDPSTVLGLTVAVAWFTGLYEGKTGKPINAALKARGAMVGEADIAAMRPSCLARMSDFSRRLQSFGT